MVPVQNGRERLRGRTGAANLSRSRGCLPDWFWGQPRSEESMPEASALRERIASTELTGVQDGNLPWPQHPTLVPFLIGQMLACGPPISLMPFLMSKMYSRTGREHLHDASRYRFVARALI